MAARDRLQKRSHVKMPNFTAGKNVFTAWYKNWFKKTKQK